MLTSNHFNSSTIRHHYHNRRQQALAFLLTIGSKALVIENQKQMDYQSTIIFQGLNDEAELKMKMINQEKIRQLKIKIMEKVSLRVWKRGRNNKLRLIDIIVQPEGKKGTFIEWKSKLNYIKRFRIDNITHIVPISSSNADSSSYPAKRKSNGKIDVDCSNVDDEPNIENPANNNFLKAPNFIRMRNPSRHLDLSFLTIEESEAFMNVINKFSSLSYLNEI